VTGPYTALRVAPDGVRVALVVGSGQQLRFGAISQQQGARPTQVTYQIRLSPFFVSTQDNYFSSVSWYGPNDVITLADQGPAVTEYPVNGGTSVSIPANAQLETISASSGQPLLAMQTNEQIAGDLSLNSSWMALRAGSSPVYPG
jgi:Lipoprotein LpqB beta-propeller domain